MGFQIEDGTGGGYQVKVRSDNMLLAYTIAESALHYRATQGRAFIWQNATYDYAAADTILWLKNTASDEEILLDTIYLWSDTATEATIHFPSGSTGAGTAVIANSFNRVSGKTANYEAFGDETGNTQGDIFLRVMLQAAVGQTIQLRESLILGNNDEVAVDFVTDGAACSVAFVGFQR